MASDTIDLKLLNSLQKDALMPMEQIADTVGLSMPACYRRVRALREAGLIRRTIAVVERKTMGWPLMMLVLVKLETERGLEIDNLFQWLRRTPEIIEANYVTGDYDFVLKVVAEDMESFDDLMRVVLYANSIVKTYKTLVTMREVKTPSAIPIAPGLASGA
jgi:Lrp/AsnC family leucine-responsive transcriptional regulator